MFSTIIVQQCIFALVSVMILLFAGTLKQNLKLA